MSSTDEEWDRINHGFTNNGTNEIIAGCVGALDGFFQCTNKPNKIEALNVIAYYSGLYKLYGVKCQACVNSNLEFMYFNVVSPGSTNNNIPTQCTWSKRSLCLPSLRVGKITGSLDWVARILVACARLHNFIIHGDLPFERDFCSDEEKIDAMNLSPDPMAPCDTSYLPVVSDEMFEVYPGISHTMEAIIELLRGFCGHFIMIKARRQTFLVVMLR
ncbi:hypothetical protein ACHAW6_012581 [Cyclotella cf. meneghiniana]